MAYKWWKAFKHVLAGKHSQPPIPVDPPAPIWEPEPILVTGLLNSAQHLLDPEIIQLFFEAKFLNVDPEDVLQELIIRAGAGQPGAVFVGWQDGRPAALSIMLPPTTLMPQLLGYHFYCGGGSRLRDLMLEEIVAWAQREGYDTCVAFAVRGGPAWEKVFAAARPRKWGDVYEFDLRGAADGFIQRRRG